MTNTKIHNAAIEKEAQHRIDSLTHGLKIKKLSLYHKKLAMLKNKLNYSKSESLANIYYTSTLQKELSETIKTVLSQYETIAQTNKNIFLVTLNYCEGRGKNKIPCFIKPEQLINFNVKKAKATICKQLNRLKYGFGFVAFEVKYDNRIGAFIPHFHILICGETEKTLKDFFTKYFPTNYEFMLNKNTFEISKYGDPLIYKVPQNLKIIDIRPIRDKEAVSTYICKFKTYASLGIQKHLTVIVEDEIKNNKKCKRKKIALLDDIHCYNLMFLDKCNLSDLFYKFNKKLMTNYVVKQKRIQASKNLKPAQSQEGLAKIKKKLPQHDTYAKPFTNNKFVLKLFKFNSYQSNQEEIINYMKMHKSCIVIQKTNFGKSLCFYATALQLQGLCIVIEPLISLIHNQVSKLNKIYRKFALAYTSETKHTEKKLKNLRKGKYKFLYVAPEMLNNKKILKALSNLNICMIVCDEAHCIDLWGHDFRPDYKKLGSFINKFPDAKVMALTATAGKSTQQVIKEVCNMKPNIKIFKGDLERTNIKYKVVKKENDGFKQLMQCIKPFLNENNRPTSSIIIYCAHIDYTVGLNKILKKQGIDSYVYNSKITNKKEVLKAFLKKNCIIIATSAFGMGIDKPDVRLVIHFEATNNLEMYYQESGRAGRDNQQAEAILFYSPREIQNMWRLVYDKSDSIKRKLTLAVQYMKIKDSQKRREFLLNNIV